MAASTGKPISDLHRAIFRVVRRIPAGKVATYGQVAELAGAPGAARAVGAAMKFSDAHNVPWQRVVGKRSASTGKVSILDPVGGTVQRKLLEEEGVEFSEAGGISLAKFGWLPTTKKKRRP